MTVRLVFSPRHDAKGRNEVAIVRENALQTALMSVLIASKKQGVDVAALVDCALSMTASYPRDSSIGVAPTRASLELQKAYQAVLKGTGQDYSKA